MDHSVKRMLKLIEEDGNSLTKSAPVRQRKPELIANVEEFQQMYRLLAERYDHLTKELFKSIPSLLQVQGLGNSESSYDQDFPLLTPDVKQGLHKSGRHGVGLDRSPSSGGASSALSLKEGNESSSSSSSLSDSESESFNSSVNLGPRVNTDSQVLQQKITELETELRAVKDELRTREADLEQEKIRGVELQMQITKLGTRVSEADNKVVMLLEELEVITESLKASTEDANKLHSLLEVSQEEIALLEVQLDSEKRHVLGLQERIERYAADISDRDHENGELKLALYDAQEQYSREKAQLQSDILSMSNEQAYLNTRLKELELRGKELEDKIVLREAENTEMERLHAAQEMTLQGEINRLKVELAERREHVEVLNKDFDRFKLNYDMLMAEKDGFSAKVNTLMANVSSRDNQIQEMERHIHQLHQRHEELIAGSESAQKLVEELKLRIEELQKEVDRQSVLIMDGAEEKREVIRQLCFSLEHYRSGYQELRQAFVSNKRRVVMAA
ncbi:hypothetical protein FEM48_Zijuj03G0120300 [Ziziphus jujuba var. spinosa]|nr:hypothetical protein FEM48_Zijuj03G0120300 [Ziziphus jujuba var. spinosa]